MRYNIYQIQFPANCQLYVRADKTIEEVIPGNELKNYGQMARINTIEVGKPPQDYWIKQLTKDYIPQAGAALGGGILAASLGFGVSGSLIGALIGFVIANTNSNRA